MNRPEMTILAPCQKNPHEGKPCCMHTQIHRAENGVIHHSERCCWCANETVWKVVSIPEHGPHKGDKYDAYRQQGGYR